MGTLKTVSVSTYNRPAQNSPSPDACGEAAAPEIHARPHEVDDDAEIRELDGKPHIRPACQHLKLAAEPFGQVQDGRIDVRHRSSNDRPRASGAPLARQPSARGQRTAGPDAERSTCMVRGGLRDDRHVPAESRPRAIEFTKRNHRVHVVVRTLEQMQERPAVLSWGVVSAVSRGRPSRGTKTGE